MEIMPKAGYKTLRNWLKIGKKPKRGKTGEKCWTNRYCQLTAIYYPESDVRDMTDEEKEKYKEQENRKRRKTEKARLARKKAEELEQKMAMERSKGYHKGLQDGKVEALKEYVYGTAREWLMRGRKVVDHPQIDMISGDAEFGEKWQFWYYHITDTAPCSNEEKERLLSLWTKLVLSEGQKYKGHKWW